MSRALGTAFLTHQVAQLEKEVRDGSRSNGYNPRGGVIPIRGGPPKRGRGGSRGGRGRGGYHIPASTDDYPVTPKKYEAPAKPWIKEHPVRKVADRLVIDSSVLVHALGQVREWSRDGRQEVIIVPLEGMTAISVFHAVQLMLKAQIARSSLR